MIVVAAARSRRRRRVGNGDMRDLLVWTAPILPPGGDDVTRPDRTPDRLPGGPAGRDTVGR
ncbi:hypothetical protein GCM10022215_04500 [Nocardioides fonticola]|uniref:Uncharacterized protein n=1 Tax=Nocardioides fonticola TaxID=450363 RepID=A0ABP7XAU5_9ACTN